MPTRSCGLATLCRPFNMHWIVWQSRHFDVVFALHVWSTRHLCPEAVAELTLCDNQLEMVGNFRYLGSLVTTEDGLEAKITWLVTRAKWEFRESLVPPWYLASSQRNGVQCPSSWVSCRWDGRWIFVFDHCVPIVALIWWEHRVCNEDVYHRVLLADARRLK